MKTVALVGSTGSIGAQAIEVVKAEPDRFRVVALAASTSVDALVAQARELRPETVAIADAELGPAVKEGVPPGVDVIAGPGALEAVAGVADVVVNGVVGFAGLPVTITALEHGRRLALANKESLIAGGPVVQRVRRTPGAELVPVDSEHCAIHQCLRAGTAVEVGRMVLTASGGPFRTWDRASLATATVDDALAHPTWAMGPKITVDSSTLMNKGLEVIEAHELFGIDFDRIEVVIHPQSIVHSMVEFRDGATMAQLSLPDMRLPIAYALGYPERATVAFGALDWTRLRSLEFELPDREKFPCLGLAYEAGRAGETAPAWLNGANEVAVAAFLDGEIPWTAIAEVLKEAMSGYDGTIADSVDVVIEADRRGRNSARAAVEKRTQAA